MVGRLWGAMVIWRSFAVLGVAYLLGSIPFGYLLVRWFRKEDIRAVGSGNIGATNVVRSGAKGLGILTLALDLGKGLAAVLLAERVATGVAGGGPSALAVGAAVMAVLGHMFPVWLGFKGGKGVATALGVFLALAPWAALGAVGVFLVVVLWTRYVSLASIAAAAALPVWLLVLAGRRGGGQLGVLVAGTVFVAAVVIAKHHANLRRLLDGTESRFGAKGGTGKKVEA